MLKFIELWPGFVGGGISGIATLVGALPILVNTSKLRAILSKINMDFLIGFMLSAAAFSLILPAYSSVLKNETVSMAVSFETLSLSLVLGFYFIKLTGQFLEKALIGKEKNLESKKAFLFVIAMMVHNFPEGLAAGATMQLPGSKGYSLLGAIALQNIPEGFTTALSFLTLGLSPFTAFLGAAMTGVVELAGGLVGAYLSSSIDGVLPLLMSFAGGTMMSVVVSEILEKIKLESYSFIYRPSF
ncbi:MAG: ZIP family metal transporter [Bacteriovoracaceae bacterium]|nr:ZIP family metal transporter [Bacteriovoracaceae bacterium]